MGKRAVETVQSAWYIGGTCKKYRLGREGLNSPEIEDLLYMLANPCTTMIREKRGVMGDVARLIGGSLVAPPIDPVNTQRYFGDPKAFGAVDELVVIVTGGVSLRPKQISSARYRTETTAISPSTCQHLKKNGEDVRRRKMLRLVMQKISRPRNPQSQSLSAGGCRDTEVSDNQ